MATQTVLNERLLPQLVAIAPSSDAHLTAKGLATVRTARDLLHVWIVALEAMDAMVGPCNDDMGALGLMMGAIRQQLERVDDDGVSTEFYAAKGTVHSMEMYFCALMQNCTMTEVAPDVLARSAGHAYELLAGVCSASERAS